MIGLFLERNVFGCEQPFLLGEHCVAFEKNVCGGDNNKSSKFESHFVPTINPVV